MPRWKWTISDEVEAESLSAAVEKVTDRLKGADAFAIVLRPLEGQASPQPVAAPER